MFVQLIKLKKLTITGFKLFVMVLAAVVKQPYSNEDRGFLKNAA